MAEAPQEELPPQISTVFAVGLGLSDGSGSLRILNKAAEAVEMVSGSTAALAKGSESGSAATRISRQVA